MNLLEAIESGKRFRRKLDHRFYIDQCSNYCFTREDLFADDYEIEEEKVTITRSQLWVAIMRNFPLYAKGENLGNAVLLELGFLK